MRRDGRFGRPGERSELPQRSDLNSDEILNAAFVRETGCPTLPPLAGGGDFLAPAQLCGICEGPPPGFSAFSEFSAAKSLFGAYSGFQARSLSDNGKELQGGRDLDHCCS